MQAGAVARACIGGAPTDTVLGDPRVAPLGALVAC
jgi:hypothetical protein